MKKISFKLLALLALISISLCVIIPTAAEGKVTYDGEARDFIFEYGSEHSLTDLFDSFKEVMPGDKLTQKITVRNDSAKNVKVNIYMRSLGAAEGSEDFLSKLHMTVAPSSDNIMAYMFNASADVTDGLTDWVFLGTLYSGGEVNLDVTLDVPIELGNEYQDAIGFIDWQFRIEEMPVEPDDPEPPPTGDDAFLPITLAIVGVCGSVFVLFIIMKRRREAEEN